MRKMKSCTIFCLHEYVSDFRDAFTSVNKVPFVQACRKSVVKQQHSQVTQHLSRSKHIATVAHLKDQPGMQSVIGETFAAS
jgi:hypothetical protein